MSFLQGLFDPPNIEKMKANRDLQGLIKALEYQKDASVRSGAAKALGELKDARAGIIYRRSQGKMCARQPKKRQEELLIFSVPIKVQEKGFVTGKILSEI
jgi:hypothetical protein